VAAKTCHDDGTRVRGLLIQRETRVQVGQSYNRVMFRLGVLGCPASNLNVLSLDQNCTKFQIFELGSLMNILSDWVLTTKWVNTETALAAWKEILQPSAIKNCGHNF
jgi:hypothetical protein